MEMSSRSSHRWRSAADEAARCLLQHGSVVLAGRFALKLAGVPAVGFGHLCIHVCAAFLPPSACALREDPRLRLSYTLANCRDMCFPCNCMRVW